LLHFIRFRLGNGNDVVSHTFHIIIYCHSATLVLFDALNTKKRKSGRHLALAQMRLMSKQTGSYK